jgi:REP element-mobilizing transposase RayT
MNEKRNPIKMALTMECELFVNLTKEERENRAVISADLRRDINTKEYEFDKIKNQFKAEIRELEAKHNHVHHAYVAGKEYQRVSCERIYSLEDRSTWLRYKGEEYDHRRMNDDEIKICFNPPLLDDIDNPNRLRVLETK